jgi:hypothetical protein
MADAVKDASWLYEVERSAHYGARPDFRITDLQISPSQKVPWHCHNNIQDTFYVVEGTLRPSCWRLRRSANSRERCFSRAPINPSSPCSAPRSRFER